MNIAGVSGGGIKASCGINSLSRSDEHPLCLV